MPPTHNFHLNSDSPSTPDSIDLLRNVTILASLDEEGLRSLNGAARMDLPPGQVVVHQGEACRVYWILLLGTLSISSVSPDGHEHVLHLMPHGSAFGETTLLANIASAVTVCTETECDFLKLDETQFWHLMTSYPEVRQAIIGDLATRLARLQAGTSQQARMASLGTLAAGLMHELNNPCAAAHRASSQLGVNLSRMNTLTAKFSQDITTLEQKQCIAELQERAMVPRLEHPASSLEHADAEESLVAWMEAAGVEEAWRLAPTLASCGIGAKDLQRARDAFLGIQFADAVAWLEALISSRQLVGVIEESVSRVTKLVETVKTYAYETHGDIREIDVNASVDATLVMLSDKLQGKQIRIETDFAPDLMSLRTECDAVNQIWTTILENAIYATPRSGTITVRTWSEEVSKSVSSGERTDLCVLIGDNGEGIPLSIQSRIFDPFFTTKPVGAGGGLGLGIASRIVDQCGGSIRFTSAPGNTEFLIRLPVRK